MVTTNCVGRSQLFRRETVDKSRGLILYGRPVACLLFVLLLMWMMFRCSMGDCRLIPLQRAIADGCTRNVVVLTRNRGYRKDTKDIRIPSLFTGNIRKLREALSRRVLFTMSSWKWWNKWRWSERLSSFVRWSRLWWTGLNGMQKTDGILWRRIRLRKKPVRSLSK